MMPIVETLESNLWLKSLVDVTLKSVMSFTADRDQHPLTKAAVAMGLFILIGFIVPMGAMGLVEAENQEDALYEEIQIALDFQPEPLPENATDEEKAARDERYQRNWERGLQLCEQFLSTYPESERYDAVLYKKLIYLRNLGRNAEFEAGVEAILSKHPSSKYTSEVRRLRAYYLESQFRLREALAEWDGIDDPTLLHKVYERKGQIYGQMGNWAKRVEFDLLRAELILGKPAPEFSHTSVDSIPISLADLRGKVVVLYHWSTQDGRTVRDDETGGEISILKRLHDMHGENPNFVLITVCLQSSEAKLKEFIKTHAMPGIHLLLEHGAVPYKFGVNGWPYYVILDKAGILRESEHGFVLRYLEVEQLVEALLAEDTEVPGERIIPRTSLSRAGVYDSQDQDEKAIAEYEKLLAFTPDNLTLMMRCLYSKREQADETATLMNRAYNRIVELSRYPQNLELGVSYDAVELAHLFSQQGDREKTWTLFQIAVAHDESKDNHAINYAKRNLTYFAAIQNMPEFQKLLTDSPQTEMDKRIDEANRKQLMYAKDLNDAHRSFTAVEADEEIFTGVILSRDGHVLVPASVAEAKVVRARFVDYQPAKVVAVDAVSGLGVVHVHGQKYLRPVAFGNVDDLREYAPIPLPNSADGYTYPSISTISARGYPNDSNLPPEVHQRAVGHPTERVSSIMQLEINDAGEVTMLKAGTPGRSGGIIGGDALVYYDGRLLAIALEDEVRYDRWGPSAGPIPIDQIRAALERMNLLHLAENAENRFRKTAEGFELVVEAEDFTRLDGVKLTVQPFLTVEDVTTSGGAFIVANTALTDQYQIPDSWLTYEIEIPVDGDYAIWLYGRAYGGKSDSFFVGTDLETPIACDVHSFGGWGAVPAVDRTSPKVVPAFPFTQGLHEIRLFLRETGTELDAILITNDLSLGAAEINRRFMLQNCR